MQGWPQKDKKTQPAVARYPNLTAGLDIRYFRDRSYLLLSANPYLSFALQENVSGYVQADINWQNSDDEKDAEQCEIELTNACLSLAKGGVSADLGLQTILVGNGLIMADDVPAITLDFSVGSSNLQMTLARVLDSSPMAVVTIGHQPGGFENLAVFGVWIRDEEDAFAKSLPPVYQLLFRHGDYYRFLLDEPTDPAARITLGLRAGF